MSPAEAVTVLKNDYPQARLVFGGFGKGAKTILEFGGQTEDVIAFVGPEGGLAESEEQFLRDNGACAVRLAENILRVETAAVALAAVLAARRLYSGGGR